MKFNKPMAVFTTILFAAAMVAMYVAFFNVKDREDQEMLPVILIIPAVICIFIINEFCNTVYERVGYYRSVFNSLLLVKLTAYILICQALINLISHDWGWWILSVVLGIVVLVVEIFWPLFKMDEEEHFGTNH